MRKNINLTCCDSVIQLVYSLNWSLIFTIWIFMIWVQWVQQFFILSNILNYQKLNGCNPEQFSIALMIEQNSKYFCAIYCKTQHNSESKYFQIIIFGILFSDQIRNQIIKRQLVIHKITNLISIISSIGLLIQRTVLLVMLSHVILYKNMPKDLTGKVAIVTASSTGIGKAIAKRFAQDGCKVVVSSRSQDNVDKAVQQIKNQGGDAIGMVCDVAKKEDRARLINNTVKQFGGIDYLVCNAAITIKFGNYLNAKEKDVTKLWEVNYMATFLMIQEAVPFLKQKKDSSIVIISSYTAYDLSPGLGHYAISKTALVAMTKVLSKQLLSDNIRVNCIAPGLIKTEFSSILWKNREQEAKKDLKVNRLGQVEDIAGVAKFLVSKDSSYITGQCIVACGTPISRL